MANPSVPGRRLSQVELDVDGRRLDETQTAMPWPPVAACVVRGGTERKCCGHGRTVRRADAERAAKPLEPGPRQFARAASDATRGATSAAQNVRLSVRLMPHTRPRLRQTSTSRLSSVWSQAFTKSAWAEATDRGQPGRARPNG